MNEHDPPSQDPPPVVVARPLSYATATASPPDEMLLPRVSRRDALLDLLLVTLLAVVIRYVPGVLLSMVDAEFVELDLGAAILLDKFGEAASAIVLLAYMITRHRLPARAFGLRADNLGIQTLWSVGTVVGIYVALIGSAMIVMVFVLAMPELLEDVEKRVEFVQSMPTQNVWFTLALLTAVAVHEELIFRALLLTYARRVFGSWWIAAAGTAALFAVLHMPHQGVIAALQIFGIGFVLAIFYTISRSLWAVVLAHLAFNYIQFQIASSMPLREILERLEQAG